MQRERLIPVRVRLTASTATTRTVVYVVQFMTSGKPAKENGKLSWLRDHAQAVCAKPSETHMAQGRASDTRARALSSKHTRTCARSRAHRLSQNRANAKRAGALAQTQTQTHARTHIRAHTLARTKMRCCSAPHLPAIFARVRKSHLGVRRSRSLQEQQEGLPSSFGALGNMSCRERVQRVHVLVCSTQGFI